MYSGWLFSSGFWQCVVPYKSTTVSEECAACLHDRYNTLFQNVGAHLLNYTVSYHRRHYHKILKYERNWRHLRTKCSEEYCIYWIISHAPCGFSTSKLFFCFELVSFMGAGGVNTADAHSAFMTYFTLSTFQNILTTWLICAYLWHR